MALENARRISDLLTHRDAIPGLEVSERQLMPMEYQQFSLTPEQVAAMDETMELKQ